MLLVLAAAGWAWPLFAHAHEGFARLRTVDIGALLAAALLHVAMLVASAMCWRHAFGAHGGHVGRADACVRYGVGTFLNAVTPARAGGAVRIGLFARSFGNESNVRRAGLALAGIGFVRVAAVTLLVAAAALAGIAPRWLVVAPFVLAAAALLARRRAKLHRSDAAVLFGWAALASCCRCASIVAALAAVGVDSPVSAGIVGLVGLELSSLVPLAPGIAGVGGAAVAVAIVAHGVPSATAFAGGVAFYVAEGAAGIAFGLAATASFILARQSRAAEGDVPVPVW